MTRNFMNRLFTESVKAAQEQYGARESQSRHEGGELVRDHLTDAEASFIQSRDSFYMATVNHDGWPYLQFRGGPVGFLKMIDSQTFAYADFRGNRQYISMGNIRENERTALFMMDYPSQSRLKLMVQSQVLDAKDNSKLVEAVADLEYPAPIERVVLFHVVAYDWNCPKHITPRYTEEQWATLDQQAQSQG